MVRSRFRSDRSAFNALVRWSLVGALGFVIARWPAPARGDASPAVIDVSNVEELYAAVNDPAHEGATIQLRPGTYVLTPLDPNGQVRPNGGSLLLKAGMTLQGENEYEDHDADGVPDARDDDGEAYADPATETIIDGDSLTTVTQGLVWAPVVVAGPIEVSIRNLTIRGGRRALAAIEVRAPGNDASRVTVRECTLEAGRRGILVDAAARWGSSNAEVDMVAERNVIRDHRVDHLPGFSNVTVGWGIQTQTARVLGSRLALHLKHNRFTRNKVGLFVSVLGGQDGEVTVVSQGNIYEEAVLTEDAVLGPVLATGIATWVRAQSGDDALRNHVRLVSKDDAIWNNVGWAGLYVEGARLATDGAKVMDNSIDIQLLGTRFVKLGDDGELDGAQNQEARELPGLDTPARRDILIVGANHSADNGALPPGEGFLGEIGGNRVSILMRGTTSSVEATDYDADPHPFLIVDNEPDEVEIDLLGTLTDFERTNTGWNVPE